MSKGFAILRSQTTESVITLYISGLFEHHGRLWLLVLSLKKDSMAQCCGFSDGSFFGLSGFELTMQPIIGCNLLPFCKIPTRLTRLRSPPRNTTRSAAIKGKLLWSTQ